jgi:hypothetical protein
MERGPIFVAGAERSGTSLLYALLGSHPNIAMTRRTNLWRHFHDQYGDLRDPDNLERCVDMMMSYKRLAVLQPDFDRLRRDFLVGERTYARLFALLEEQYAERLGKPRWGDKSLHTEHYADFIFPAYSGARILHMIRDPRDRYASSQARWEVRRGGVGAGTAEWLSSVRFARRNQQRYPHQYRIVRYESLATEPEQTLREICEFVGEEYAPEMLTMEGATRFREQGSNSSYGRYDPGAISTKSIGRFRQVLSPRQIAFIQLLAKHRMALFDYTPERLRLSFGQHLRFTAADLPIESMRLLAWWTLDAIGNRTGRPVPAYRLVERERAS